MNLARLGGVIAGAMLAVPLLSPVAASAAVQAPASATPVTFASDCGYTHWYNGYWHRYARWVCDDDGGYYYGGGNFRGHDFRGDEHRGGGEHRGGAEHGGGGEHHGRR